VIILDRRKVGSIALLIMNILTIADTLDSLMEMVDAFEKHMTSWGKLFGLMKLGMEKGYNDVAKSYKGLKKKKPIVDKKYLSYICCTDDGWPCHGHIILKNLCVRYQKELPEVLHRINLDIKGGTKLAIVGRTGAGKTTLCYSLVRTFHDYEGEIVIDGIELKGLDNKELREKIKFIVANPYFANGTLRKSMDPQKDFADDDIIHALKKFGMWDRFLDLEGRNKGKG